MVEFLSDVLRQNVIQQEKKIIVGGVLLRLKFISNFGIFLRMQRKQKVIPEKKSPLIFINFDLSLHDDKEFTFLSSKIARMCREISI